MSKQAFTDIDGTGVPNRSAASEPSDRARWLHRILPLILVLVVFLAVAVTYPTILTNDNGSMPLIFSLAMSVSLSVLPMMICVVQNTTRRRQMNRLVNLKQFPVSRSAYFRIALTSVDGIRTGAVDADFEAPLFVYCLMVFVLFFALFIGYTFKAAFTTPSIMLGGLHDTADVGYVVYQAGTFCMMGMAFIAAYAYSLSRLLDRVNNHDLYPLSLIHI